MDVSFQDRDNFIRNMVTIAGCGRGAGGPPMRKISTGGLPVPVDEILLDLRVDDPDDEAETVERLARGACAFIERRTGFVLLPTVYEVQLSAWPTSSMQVLRGPFRQVDGVTYQAARDDWQEVDADDYWVSSGDRDFTLRFLSDFASPSLWQNEDCIRVRFQAGFDAAGESGGDQPIEDGLRTILLMVTGHYYKNREILGAADPTSGAEAVELGATSLLGQYRQFW